MSPIWTLAALAGLIVAPALAQTKIPPSHLYSNQPPAGLDKDYGLPKSVLPGPELPQRKATAAKPQDEPEAFTGLSTVDRPQTQPSDVPNFFQASPDAQTSDVPNFFQESPNIGLPKVAKSQSAYSTMDTPLFTTTDGSASSDSPFDGMTTGDTTAPDGARTR